jgi:hypothetical protein
MATEEPKDPSEQYDNEHGKPTGGTPNVPENEQWGQDLNPVRETPLAGKGLNKVGG